MSIENSTKDFTDTLSKFIDEKLKPIQAQIDELKKAHTIEIKVTYPEDPIKTLENVFSEMKSKIKEAVYTK